MSIYGDNQTLKVITDQKSLSRLLHRHNPVPLMAKSLFIFLANGLTKLNYSLVKVNSSKPRRLSGHYSNQARRLICTIFRVPGSNLRNSRKII